MNGYQPKESFIVPTPPGYREKSLEERTARCNDYFGNPVLVLQDLKCYFKIKELINPDIVDAFAGILTEDVLWNMIPFHVQKDLATLRRLFDAPIRINYGHGYVNSGLRAKNCEIGATLSKHKRGLAFDLKADDMPKLFELIMHLSKSEKFLMKRMENPQRTPTWFHCEWGMDYTDGINKEPLEFFNP